ncbi:hypothetical protein V8E54_013832 [Elaphomyces granulatus]
MLLWFTLLVSGVKKLASLALFTQACWHELQQEVHRLPSCLSTLKRQTTVQPPLLSVQKKSLPLQSEQLGKEKSAAGLLSTGLREDLYFFDPIAVFTAFLRSDICNQMYCDKPQEL